MNAGVMASCAERRCDYTDLIRIGWAEMKTLQLREAKSRFSAVIDDATKGEPTIVTKHGRPAAMVVPIEDARRLYPDDRPSLASLLMHMPCDLEIERDETPVRAIDL